MLSYQQPTPVPDTHIYAASKFQPFQETLYQDPTANNFQRMIQALSAVLGPSSGIDSDDVDENDLIRIMEAYTSEESEWIQYAFVDGSANYTRNLVDEGNGKSNVLILVWNPGKGSPIHDHANAHCVMKVLKGRLEETLYTIPSPADEVCRSKVTPTPPAVQKQTIYSRDQVTYISDKIGLHKMSNPSSTEVAVSLHLYTPPHAANFGFHLFDARTGRATHVKQAGFYSDRGKVVKNNKYGTL